MNRMSKQESGSVINKSVNIGGDNYGPISTGDTYIQSKDTPENIRATFEEKTTSALRYSRPKIEGLPDVIARAEVDDIEKLIQIGESVLVIGEPGTGKSGISYLLAERAKQRGQAHLVLNCRLLQSVRTEQDLKGYLSLDAFSLARACSAVRSDGEPFLLIVDQLDSVLGVEASDAVLEAALGCHEKGDIRVVVFSRSGEAREKNVIETVSKEGFTTVSCEELTDATAYLLELGIASPSQELLGLARNLLHLSLIAKIKQKKPDADFSALTSEVALWEERLKVFNEQHKIKGATLIATLTSLAATALKSEDGTFVVDDPPSDEHEPLLSEQLIRRQYLQSDVCLFTHERMQDFLYARWLLKKGKDATFATQKLGPFRAHNVHIWLNKIAKADNVPERETILRNFFDV